MKIKIKKISSLGFAHILSLIVIVAAVAAIGTYVLVASHADSISSILYNNSTGAMVVSPESGTNQQTLGYGITPFWINNQSNIIYADQLASGYYLYEETETGANQVQIAGPIVSGLSTAWSQALEKLAVTECNNTISPPVCHLVVMSADGSSPKTIVTTSDLISVKSWSPNGAYLLYADNSTGKVHMVNESGSSNKILPISGYVSSEAWNPTSTAFVYGVTTTPLKNTTTGLYDFRFIVKSYNLSTKASTRLVSRSYSYSGNSQEWAPVAEWSPSGTYIAFSMTASLPGGPTPWVCGLYEFPAGTTSPTVEKVEHCGTNYLLAGYDWSPDSSSLAYIVENLSDYQSMLYAKTLSTGAVNTISKSVELDYGDSVSWNY